MHTEREVRPATERRSPAPWEEEETFHDALYNWMGRAPWLAISTAAHLVVFLVIQAIPWALFEKVPEVQIQASLAEHPEILPEDPPDEPEQQVRPRGAEPRDGRSGAICGRRLRGGTKTGGRPRVCDAARIARVWLFPGHVHVESRLGEEEERVRPRRLVRCPFDGPWATDNE